MDRGARWAVVRGAVRVGHDLVTKPPPLLFPYSFVVFVLTTVPTPIHCNFLFVGSANNSK